MWAHTQVMCDTTYILSNLNFSTNNSRRDPTRVVNTFETNEYGAIQSVSVNNVFPILSQYNWSRGMYRSSFSEDEENEEFEGESLLSNEPRDCSGVSANSSSSSLSLSSSPSSLCTTTSAYSNFTLPSYVDLLDYSPAKVEQPQSMYAILVPKECINDPKLRCPPEVVITRSPRENLTQTCLFLLGILCQTYNHLDSLSTS